MNRKLFSTFFSRFSLKDYAFWTYVVCVAALIGGAATKFIELNTIWDALAILIWPIYGTWLFLRFFVFEMIAYDTVIPSWIGYICILFFVGWAIAIYGLRRKKVRRFIILLLLLFALVFIGGCTYMTAALSPFGLI